MLLISKHNDEDNFMMTLLLITSAPTSKSMWYALKLAHALKQQQREFKVFFYQDAVQIANRLIWQPDDQMNLQQGWLNLNIALPVCVSASLNRGISDTENAQRHQLQQSNLAEGFKLVGLGELADLTMNAERIIQF